MSTSLPKVFVGSSSESLHVAQALQSSLEVCSEVRIWDQDLFQTGNSVLEDLLNLTKGSTCNFYIVFRRCSNKPRRESLSPGQCDT